VRCVLLVLHDCKHAFDLTCFIDYAGRRGESAVDLAVKEGHEAIVALMRAYELVANDPTFAHELNSPPVPNLNPTPLLCTYR
jgi:hypothetical protein